jgi:hypothetical protein
MNVDLIEFDENEITVIDTDGNSYTIFIESDNEAESEIAEAILTLAESIMETIPPDDEDGDREVPYFSEDDEDDEY